MGGDEGERVGGREISGPILTASQCFTETVAVRVLDRTTFPVIDLAFPTAVGAGIVLPAIDVIIVDKEVIEVRKRIVRAVSV